MKLLKKILRKEKKKWKKRTDKEVLYEIYNETKNKDLEVFVDTNLKKMDIKDFHEFYEFSYVDYAQELVLIHKVERKSAVDFSKMIYEDLIALGVESKDNYFYNIEYKDKKVGYVWLSIEEIANKKYLYISDLFIFNDYRAKGIGSAIFYHLEFLLKDMNLDGIRLNVFNHNKKAIKFYRKMGFKTTTLYMERS